MCNLLVQMLAEGEILRALQIIKEFDHQISDGTMHGALTRMIAKQLILESFDQQDHSSKNLSNLQQKLINHVISNQIEMFNKEILELTKVSILDAIPSKIAGKRHQPSFEDLMSLN